MHCTAMIADTTVVEIRSIGIPTQAKENAYKSLVNLCEIHNVNCNEFRNSASKIRALKT